MSCAQDGNAVLRGFIDVLQIILKIHTRGIPKRLIGHTADVSSSSLKEGAPSVRKQKWPKKKVHTSGQIMIYTMIVTWSMSWSWPGSWSRSSVSSATVVRGWANRGPAQHCRTNPKKHVLQQQIMQGYAGRIRQHWAIVVLVGHTSSGADLPWDV